jgi:metallophosphoesterase (TIGR00282 family)
VDQKMKEFNVLAIGDIVGKPGRLALQAKLPELRREWNVHFVVANGENVAGTGSGITESLVGKLFDAGVDVITLGDHTWKKQEIASTLDREPRLLRPHNYSRRAAGTGVGLYETSAGVPVGVISVMGRLYMNTVIDCPFQAADRALEHLKNRTGIVLVDIHAEATSEKQALGWYLDGRVSAVFGTHTHVQTADERILPKGTGFLTDLGMTGPYRSVLGRRVDAVLHRFLTHMYERFDVATGEEKIAGALFRIDSSTGKTLSVQRVLVEAAVSPGEAEEAGAGGRDGDSSFP